MTSDARKPYVQYCAHTVRAHARHRGQLASTMMACVSGTAKKLEALTALSGAQIFCLLLLRLKNTIIYSSSC